MLELKINKFGLLPTKYKYCQNQRDINRPPYESMPCKYVSNSIGVI